ncbi:hypothetical protein Q8F55_000124 [Vanrija albida]|uniref:Uncharacterized protein n=1 Tax=Vanrija albida TaxID=181172 RepID=A0ABR3QCD3_9TREE
MRTAITPSCLLSPSGLPVPTVVVTPPTPRPLQSGFDDYFAAEPAGDEHLLGYGLLYPRAAEGQVRIRPRRRRPMAELDELCTAQIPGLAATAAALGLPFPASYATSRKPRTRSHLGAFLTLLFLTVFASAVLHTQVDTRAVGITMPSSHVHDDYLVVDLPRRVKFEHVIEAVAFH